MKATSKYLILIVFILGNFHIYANPIYNRESGSNEDDNGNIYYLDRHEIFCNPGEGLQAFHLYRPESNKIAYQFQCTPNKAIEGTYNEVNTEWIDTFHNNKESVRSLAYLGIDCGYFKVVNGFKMERNRNKFNQIRYKYRC